ncbi:calcium-transporting ATPase 9 plasma membrane-type [Citrus sinensis]|nr:calcium-transporting ATPase 9 plasma membrane-type [Citrus sinensis]
MSTSSVNGLLSPRDVEVGPSNDGSDVVLEDDVSSDPFDIAQAKHVPVASLKRWRTGLFDNFMIWVPYEGDFLGLSKDMIFSKCEMMYCIAIKMFLPDGIVGTLVPPAPSGDFGIGLEQLASVTRDHNFSALEQYGLYCFLLFIIVPYLTEFSLGGLARFNPYNLDCSCHSFIGTGNKDRGVLVLLSLHLFEILAAIMVSKKGGTMGRALPLLFFLLLLLQAMRGGKAVKISIFDVVVGEIVPLRIGDQVPADGVLVTGHSLAIDESSMTGESKIVRKDHKTPFLMSGCKVADGVGTMMVTGVGINTEWGLLMASISEDNGEETPLQVRLNGVATFIGIVGLAVAFLVLAVLLVRFFTGHTTKEDGSSAFVKGRTSVSDAVDGVIKIVTIATNSRAIQVTIVVVAVPEGLPLAVTLTLAYSMRKMMADKALASIIICLSSTILFYHCFCFNILFSEFLCLTTEISAVVEAFIGRKKINPPDDSSQMHSIVISLLSEGIAQNTTGNVFVPKDGEAVEVSGSPTEKAILSWAVKLGMKFDRVRSETTVLHVFPFNSEKKRALSYSIQIRCHKQFINLHYTDLHAVNLEFWRIKVKKQINSEVHVHWKGAAEMILASCTKYLDTDGQLQSIDGDEDFFKAAVDEMAARSLRCVAIAYRSCEADEVPTEEESLDKWTLPEEELILLAIVGIKDPCRPGVKDAVKLCRDAGVKVRMVTGDNLQTAKAIALECGILGSDAEANDPNIIEGKVFRALSDKEREKVAQEITVMGRSSPNDKLLLVQALRKGGDVVAVTGDGTNDAPALHEADIGLAMGIQGTEVAKENSDIIILDDNFASVVKVVRWGRSVFANIQKFIQFQLTVNVAALLINVVAAISSGDVPLNAVQLLWVNLIMDTLGALALATEPPTDHLMHRLPVGRKEPLITNIMWRNLIVQALYQVTVLLVLNFKGTSILHLEGERRQHASDVKNTMIFNAFVLSQIFNEFNARKPDEINVFTGVTKNYLFMGIIGITFVLQIIIIEFLGKFTKTVKLDWKLWLASIGIGLFRWVQLLFWPLAVLGKMIPVPKTPLAVYFVRPFQRCINARRS